MCLKDFGKTIFIDYCHLGEQGNKIIATEMVRKLIENSEIDRTAKEMSSIN